MSLKVIRKMGVVLLITLVRLSGQTSGPTPLELFQHLIAPGGPAERENMSEMEEIDQQFQSFSTPELSGALPTIVAKLDDPNMEIKRSVLRVLTDVALTNDATEQTETAALLKPYIPAIRKALLDAHDPTLQDWGVSLLGSLPSIPETVPELVNFVSRTDRDCEAQVSAVSYLSFHVEGHPEVKRAIVAVLARPLDDHARMLSLGLLPNLQISEDPEIIRTVIPSLGHPSPNVRLSTVEALGRMRPTALRLAKPALQEVLTRDVELDAVKQAAQEALQKAPR